MNELIEIKELRIGNLLSYDNQIVHVTSISLDIDDEYEDQIGFCSLGKVSNEKGGWNRSLVNKLSTIPITPEWLERCGFVKKGISWRIDVNSSDELCFYHPENVLRYQTQGDGFTRGLRHIKYLHQLQNLYFALTGEELTIKE